MDGHECRRFTSVWCRCFELSKRSVLAFGQCVGTDMTLSTAVNSTAFFYNFRESIYQYVRGYKTHCPVLTVGDVVTAAWLWRRMLTVPSYPHSLGRFDMGWSIFQSSLFDIVDSELRSQNLLRLGAHAIWSGDISQRESWRTYVHFSNSRCHASTIFFDSNEASTYRQAGFTYGTVFFGE